MVETVALSGQGVFSRSENIHVFLIYDSSKQLTGKTGKGMQLILESPELFQALEKKFGYNPSSLAIEIKLHILD